MYDLFPTAEHQVGGLRSLPLPPGVTGSAIFGGPGDCYRYLLEFSRPAARRTVMFGMMNPSTAVARAFDPSVAKVWRYAESWGFDRTLISNMHAYRATDQMRLAEVADPVGPDNDRYLLDMALQVDLVVMAYGTPRIPALRARGPQVAAMLRAAGVQLYVLELSSAGVPKHPLYLRGDLKPKIWEVPNG
jgi:hypothetical protein